MRIYLVLIFALLTACQSASVLKVGMTEEEWLSSVTFKSLVYMDGNVKAYMHDFKYFYFVDGRLTRVDQGVIPARTIRLEVR
jgi:hypothetical protein